MDDGRIVIAIGLQCSSPLSRCGLQSPQLALSPQWPIRSPSFPHAFSGGSIGLATLSLSKWNPGEFGTGPPIRTFEGDALKMLYHDPIPRCLRAVLH
jgi:hypothetical protein